MEKKESDEKVHDKNKLNEDEKQNLDSTSFKEMKFGQREKDQLGNKMIRSLGNDNSEKEKVAEQVEGDHLQPQ